ncbi:hypothetical protein [Halobaculum sp. MBLA0143]|uniref:hypothetical protein n=1 Tax=Halobaculum sp. MBLA0143 TaxID=3079933 RepID=UPI003524729D
MSGTDPTTDDRPPAVGDHFAVTEKTSGNDASDTTHTPGVYRVVGHGDGSVTLLRVGDADGRRVHTGEVVAVASLAGFEPATAPTGGGGAGERLRDGVWELRAFGSQLRRHPVAAVLAAAPLAVGITDAVTGAVAGGLILAGAGGLAAIGSGRLP